MFTLHSTDSRDIYVSLKGHVKKDLPFSHSTDNCDIYLSLKGHVKKIYPSIIQPTAVIFTLYATHCRVCPV